MNQRLIELYKEASEFAYKVCHDEGRTGGTNDHIWNTLSTGKFAELIVKETLQVARAGIEFGDGMEDAVYKYFGVAE